MTRNTILTVTLIDEICDLVSRGAVDSIVCKMIGIHRCTLWDWKRRGRDPNEHKAIYGVFYERYQQARGLRTLKWIEGVKDVQWLLTHHPDTRDDFVTLTTLKLIAL